MQCAAPGYAVAWQAAPRRATGREAKEPGAKLAQSWSLHRCTFAGQTRGVRGHGVSRNQGWLRFAKGERGSGGTGTAGLHPYFVRQTNRGCLPCSYPANARRLQAMQLAWQQAMRAEGTKASQEGHEEGSHEQPPSGCHQTEALSILPRTRASQGSIHPPHVCDIGHCWPPVALQHGSQKGALAHGLLAPPIPVPPAPHTWSGMRTLSTR